MQSLLYMTPLHTQAVLDLEYGELKITAIWTITDQFNENTHLSEETFFSFSMVVFNFDVAYIELLLLFVLVFKVECKAA
jgi:disulfide bond formation protein DsbB